jgi:hypothetical protein
MATYWKMFKIDQESTTELKTDLHETIKCHEDEKGSRGTTLRIGIGTTWKCGQIHAPATLPPRGKARSTNWIVGWGRPQGRHGCRGNEKNLLHLSGIKSRFLGCPARILVIPTTLSRIPL